MISLSRSAVWAVSAVLVGTLAACAQYPSQPPVYQQPVYQQPSYPQTSYPGGSYQNPQGTEYGRVSNIEVLQAQSRGTSGAGAILGAVVGGVLGNQVGGGSGRTAATAAGAVGGALLGNTVEGRSGQQGGNYGQGYRITIQLDQGGLRAYDVSTPGDLRVGDRVRTYNGQISRQ